MDFLFENPFLIIILLGLLSGLFGRNKQQDNEERPKPVYREQPETAEVEYEDWYMPETRQDEPVKEEALSQTDVGSIEMSNDWYNQLEQSRERLKESEVSRRKKITDVIKDGSVYRKDKKVVDDHSISVSRNLKGTALVESFVIAEVLQKPVSKRKERV